MYLHLGDDAPLTRKEAKIFFNKLKKEISDVRKLLEMSRTPSNLCNSGNQDLLSHHIKKF